MSLSILFLRFNALMRAIPEARNGTFNPLFEIPYQKRLTNLCRYWASFQSSFWDSGHFAPRQPILRNSSSFNPLFEIRHDYNLLIEAAYKPTFNPLFEILVSWECGGVAPRLALSILFLRFGLGGNVALTTLLLNFQSSFWDSCIRTAMSNIQPKHNKLSILFLRFVIRCTCRALALYSIFQSSFWDSDL